MEFTKFGLFLVLVMVLSSGCSSIHSVANGSTEGQSGDGTAMFVNQPKKVSNPYWDKNPKISIEIGRHFSNALQYMEKGEHEKAEVLFLELTQSQPKLSGPWVNLGIIAYQQGELRQSEKMLVQALKVNNLNADAYAYLGIVLREQGRFDDAEQVYRQALAVWPDNAEIQLNLGILYDLYMGQPTLALQQYLIAENLSDNPSRQLRGWIVDLERRTQSLVQN